MLNIDWLRLKLQRSWKMKMVVRQLDPSAFTS